MKTFGGGIASFFFLLTTTMVGQKATLTLDRDSILLGEQVEALVSIQYEINDDSLQVIWPQIGDDLVDGVEVIKRSKIDTVAGIDDTNMTLFEQTVRLTVTSFDSGYYAIEPLRFIVSGLEVETNPALLSVYYPTLDPAAEIRDIKDIEQIDFTLADWLALYWYWLVGGLVILAGVAWLIVWLKRREKQVAEIAPEPVVKIPAHVLALQQLDELESRKLWQDNKFKEYYTGLTNIFREYLENRYGIQAMEETTGEILVELRRKKITGEHLERIEDLLSLSDLVKFAKEKPLPQDHERAINSTRSFIDFSKVTATADV